MDPVHDKGVHRPGPYFDGPGPQTGAMDQGYMFCTFPTLNGVSKIGVYQVSYTCTTTLILSMKVTVNFLE